MDKAINIFTDKEGKGKNILILSLVIILALMHFCGKKSEGNNKSHKGFIVKKHVITDTTRVTHIDTIPFYDSIAVPFEVEVAVAIPIYDTIKEVNTYTNPFEDSLITGTISSLVEGVLVSQEFKYTPKFPKYIIKVDSIIVNNDITNTVVLNKRQLYVGMEIGGNVNSFSVSPKISLVDKKYNLFSYRYDVINKTHNFGYQKQIKFGK